MLEIKFKQLLKSVKLSYNLTSFSVETRTYCQKLNKIIKKKIGTNFETYLTNLSKWIQKCLNRK